MLPPQNILNTSTCSTKSGRAINEPFQSYWGRGSNKCSEKSRNNKLSELGWPGVKIVGAPCRDLFHTVRVSQLQSNAKSEKG